MKNGLLDILKGKFLISREAGKTWRFMLFISLLAVVMISSSHSADQKVHLIAKMNEQVQELRSEFVDTRSRLQQLKLESKVGEKVADMGLAPSENPPKKIRVK
ncbi:hypothetical protein SAMN05216480_10573 [Pustulibacterium marinum]|uniref:S-adenosyl-methyltransferase n=1 Tax=Pustulibacterium marinum TaxID=1224947 RepID=A0A1I7GM12_9FLAO|nr:FtsL-like putative cell division protein [Pustulibacterium marinum]SFU49449.1 hypothetical protein SAMN05216480_10573 [Pustulibacterium marinum]